MNPLDRQLAFAWVTSELPPRHFEPTWLGPHSYLMPMPSGAILRWFYNEVGGDTYSLVVRLTESEAQMVFESDLRIGMLESIRKTLHWRGALVFVTDERGNTTRSWRYIIQGDTSEEEFVHDLMNPPADVFRDAARSAQSRQDIEYAMPILVGAHAS